MNVGPVQTFVIENESEADEYLTDLFAKPEPISVCNFLRVEIAA
jgi:hypothetical protein